MDKNSQGNGQSFDRVESRIELLEKQLMEKDKELKKLLNASRDEESKIAKLQDGTSEDASDTFVPVFRPIKDEGEAEATEDDIDHLDLPEGIKQQLKVIAQRENRVAKILDMLEEAFDILKERNQTLNKKEDTLNREYLKLLEIESMYKGTDQLADSLGAVLPSFGQKDQKESLVKEVADRQIEE